MRDDLLDVKACVDWAVSKFKSLEKRIEGWIDINFELDVKDPDPNVPNNVIVARHERPIPTDIHVEVGCLINKIRSSLDLLATSLAHRFGVPRPDEAYFPVAKSAAAFASGDYKGSKFVKALPASEIASIETLKPYDGGNPALWSLHQLDIMRKHRRLLGAIAGPSRFIITFCDGSDPLAHFTPEKGGTMLVNNQESVIGLIAKTAPYCEMSIAGQIAICETSFASAMPVLVGLREFAGLANSIIELCDS